MALVNTTDNQEVVDIKSEAQLVRILQGLVADESGAAAAYSRIIESCKDKEEYSDIVEHLDEIRNDELHHAGVLLKLILQHDPKIIDVFKNEPLPQ